VVGTGANGQLPVMKEVLSEAQRRKIELLIFPTAEAIEALTTWDESAHREGRFGSFCSMGHSGNIVPTAYATLLR